MDVGGETQDCIYNLKRGKQTLQNSRPNRSKQGLEATFERLVFAEVIVRAYILNFSF